MLDIISLLLSETYFTDFALIERTFMMSNTIIIFPYAAMKMFACLYLLVALSGRSQFHSY